MSRTGAFGALPAETPFAGLRRRTFSSDHATVAEYTFEPGATFPLHSHAQEQITLIEEGEVELRAGGRTETLAAGAWSVLPGGVEHGITAGPAGARIVAVLVPRRETSDAYTLTTPEP